MARAPWYHWPVAGFAVLWYLAGALDYALTQFRVPQYLGQFTPDQQAYFTTMPAWVDGAWAVGVWIGLLGAVLLLLRNGAAGIVLAVASPGWPRLPSGSLSLRAAHGRGHRRDRGLDHGRRARGLVPGLPLRPRDADARGAGLKAVPAPGRLVRALALAVVTAGAAASEMPECRPMDLPVARVEAPPSQYSAFCERARRACDLLGASRLSWSPDLQETLAETNAEVNEAVRLVPDWENSGREELWSFPADGNGDCEDFALEKRRLLVAEGVPSAALTCAIAFHADLFLPHAVLLVETTAGTLVLDNLSDEVRCWDAVPYVFTRRERPDGRWTRFERP